MYAASDPVTAIAVQGRKAYVGQFRSSVGGQALTILNLTDPTNLKIFGSRTAPTHCFDLEIEGDMLFAGCDGTGGFPDGDGDLFIYNVTNPYSLSTAPILDSFVDMEGLPTGLDMKGHFLYLATYKASASHGFYILDIEDPTDIQHIANTITFSELLDVDVEGQLAYLADGTFGLYLVNVSNPYVLTTKGSVNTPGNATAVLVDGSYVYVADGGSGLHVIDASNPANPKILGSYDTPGTAQALALQGATLFVADGAGGLQVVDVADPTHPSNVTRVSLPYTYDVALYGGDVVVATASGVYTLRIGNGFTSLPLVASYSGGFEFWDVRVQGDIAYVAAGSDGLLTFNVSDPAAPVLLDQYDIGGVFRKLDVQGHLAFVADYGSAFRVFDVSDPTNIEFTDSRGLSYATDVCVAGDVAYIADGPSGVYVYNVSNPYNIPGPITSFGPPTENVTALWVQGYHLYVVTQTSGAGGLLIYDIRDISSPTLVRRWTPVTTNHYDVFVDGDSLYLADGLGYVEVWNVTNPFTAYYSDFIHYSSEKPTGVWGFGPYLLAGLYGTGIDLINTTDIYNMAVISSHPSPKAALQVTVHGDYVYVANYSSLVIHRLFRSAGATYATGSSIAESVAVDATPEVIVNATLSLTGFLPAFTGITWQLSADGGAHWEAVTPGALHTFTNTGSDLRWRATFTTGRDDRSAHLYSVSITYGHTVITSLPPPIPGFPAAAIAIGAALSLGLVLALRQRKPRKQ